MRRNSFIHRVFGTVFHIDPTFGITKTEAGDHKISSYILSSNNDDTRKRTNLDLEDEDIKMARLEKKLKTLSLK